jgi:excisionase family DNA binding protein
VTPGRVTALACTFREAARLLRIDRSSTLHDLIRAGRLRPVSWGRRRRIPLEQIQELAREGFTISARRPRVTSRVRKSEAFDAEAFARLDVAALARRDLP